MPISEQAKAEFRAAIEAAIQRGLASRPVKRKPLGLTRKEYMRLYQIRNREKLRTYAREYKRERKIRAGV